MRHKRFAGSALTAALTVALVIVAAAAAKNIVGTARNDVLRGSAKADTIYGKAGNDRLFGLGGNDRLYGGAGADRLSCGAGMDIAYADSKDTVASDCEVVRGLKPPPPPPQPPPPPTPPPAPPPPPPPPPPPAPAPTAQPGKYCGFTNNGFGICFDVTADGHGFTNAIFQLKTPCSPPATLTATITTSSVTPIQPDLTFDFEENSGGQLNGSYIKGKLDTVGNASGVVHVQAELDSGGTHYSCRMDTEWSAKRS
jgi:hypothetical protein